jgi:hypothetical protein
MLPPYSVYPERSPRLALSETVSEKVVELLPKAFVRVTVTTLVTSDDTNGVVPLTRNAPSKDRPAGSPLTVVVQLASWGETWMFTVAFSLNV